MSEDQDRNDFYYRESSNGHIPSSVHQDNPTSKRKIMQKWPYFIMGGIILVIAIFVGLGLAGIGPVHFSKQGVVIGQKNNDWQAVFLVGGQVYFGHLKDTDQQYLTLSNIYYLQAKNSDSIQSSKKDNTTTENPNDLQLVKLGNELHGPQDEMKINRDQVLFYEDLKSDGKVVQSIEKFQKGG